MLNVDVKDLLLLAKLSNIAYVDDVDQQDAQCAALGFQTICPRYQNVDHRALIVRNESRTILVLCGTRFSDGNILELFDDGDLLPYLPDLSLMAGFAKGLSDLIKWATAEAPNGFEVTGHSLGGARAHLVPHFLPTVTKVTSYGAPKCATRGYWEQAKVIPTRVVHAHDFAPGFPTLSEWHQPEPMLWLENNNIAETTESAWSGGWSIDDHNIEHYIQVLQGVS